MMEFVMKATGMLVRLGSPPPPCPPVSCLGCVCRVQCLDEVQCLEMVEAFLVGGFRGTVKEFTQQLKTATQTHALLHKVGKGLGSRFLSACKC